MYLRCIYYYFKNQQKSKAMKVKKISPTGYELDTCFSSVINESKEFLSKAKKFYGLSTTNISGMNMAE